MGIDAGQLRKYIIEPTLRKMPGLAYSDSDGKQKSIIPYSYSAVTLLLGTAAVESQGGKYLRQLHGGPALGPYQMEPATHDDIWDSFLAYHPKYTMYILDCLDMSQPPHASRCLWDLKYATIMARIHYMRIKAALPWPGDFIGLAEYWKKYYNTENGKGTVEKFIESFDKYVGIHKC